MPDSKEMVKVLFLNRTPISEAFLPILRKNATVNLDDDGRIVEYDDGELELRENHKKVNPQMSLRAVKVENADENSKNKEDPQSVVKEKTTTRFIKPKSEYVSISSDSESEEDSDSECSDSDSVNEFFAYKPPEAPESANSILKSSSCKTEQEDHAEMFNEEKPDISLNNSSSLSSSSTTLQGTTDFVPPSSTMTSSSAIPFSRPFVSVSDFADQLHHPMVNGADLPIEDVKQETGESGETLSRTLSMQNDLSGFARAVADNMKEMNDLFSLLRNKSNESSFSNANLGRKRIVDHLKVFQEGMVSMDSSLQDVQTSKKLREYIQYLERNNEDVPMKKLKLAIDIISSDMY